MKKKERSLAEAHKKLLRMSNISLMLDSYDDIFSDFDPRDYSERSLSVDFLHEAERASHDKKLGAVELNLMVPSKRRDKKKESIIKQRLKRHFKKHSQRLQKERSHIIKNGVLFVVLGMICMFVAVAISHKLQNSSIFRSFLIVIFEPAGWFLFWEGLNHTLFESKKLTPELEFYRKMHGTHISFIPYH